EDFIFGTLSTDDSRIAHLRFQRGGVTHAQQRSPRDPLPDQAISIDLTVGPTYAYNRAWIYWTDDGSDPEGRNGKATNGHVTSLESVDSEWDTLLWGYVRRFGGKIPGQRAGIVVRYRISAGNN